MVAHGVVEHFISILYMVYTCTLYIAHMQKANVTYQQYFMQLVKKCLTIAVIKAIQAIHDLRHWVIYL